MNHIDSIKKKNPRTFCDCLIVLHQFFLWESTWLIIDHQDVFLFPSTFENTGLFLHSVICCFVHNILALVHVKTPPSGYIHVTQNTKIVFCLLVCLFVCFNLTPQVFYTSRMMYKLENCQLTAIETLYHLHAKESSDLWKTNYRNSLALLLKTRSYIIWVLEISNAFISHK